MNTQDNSDALIDLGAASVETQGIGPTSTDHEGVGLDFGMSTED